MPIKYFIAFFLLSVLLSACPGEPEAEHTTQSFEKLEKWRLESHHQGRIQWEMSAQNAEQRHGLTTLTEWNWELGPHWKLTALRAQLKDQHIALQDVKGRYQDLRVLSPQTQIDLEMETLTGQAIQIEHAQWKIQGQSFQTQTPLSHWSLQDVHAQFNS